MAGVLSDKFKADLVKDEKRIRSELEGLKKRKAGEAEGGMGPGPVPKPGPIPEGVQHIQPAPLQMGDDGAWARVLSVSLCQVLSNGSQVSQLTPEGFRELVAVQVATLKRLIKV